MVLSARASQPLSRLELGTSDSLGLRGKTPSQRTQCRQSISYMPVLSQISNTPHYLSALTIDALPIAPLDAASDGLTLNEEHAAGTDPSNPDTDAGGISDGDEINLYGTDPSVPNSVSGTQSAQVPAMSPSGIALTTFLLMGIGAWAVKRSTRRR
jgi:hypothetical protein